MRFEVGYGLEGAVPDALARRIIAETIAPRFYEGDYGGGMNAGLDALLGLIDGEPLPVPVAREPAAEPHHCTADRVASRPRRGAAVSALVRARCSARQRSGPAPASSSGP